MAADQGGDGAQKKSKTLVHTVKDRAKSLTFIVFDLYKAVLRGPCQALVPAHTREATFQLFCDLRTNTPKDRKWVQRHMAALTPKTGPGWLALGAAGLYATSSLALLLLLAIAVGATVLYTALFAFVVAGIFGGFTLAVVSWSLIAASLIAGWCGLALTMGYIFVEAFTKSCTTVYNVVSSSPLVIKAKSKRGGAAQTRPHPQEERPFVEERSSVDEAPDKEDLPLSEPSFADQLISEKKAAGVSSTSSSTSSMTNGGSTASQTNGDSSVLRRVVEKEHVSPIDGEVFTSYTTVVDGPAGKMKHVDVDQAPKANAKGTQRA